MKRKINLIFQGLISRLGLFHGFDFVIMFFFSKKTLTFGRDCWLLLFNFLLGVSRSLNSGKSHWYGRSLFSTFMKLGLFLI